MKRMIKATSEINQQIKIQNDIDYDILSDDEVTNVNKFVERSKKMLLKFCSLHPEGQPYLLQYYLEIPFYDSKALELVWKLTYCVGQKNQDYHHNGLMLRINDDLYDKPMPDWNTRLQEGFDSISRVTQWLPQSFAKRTSYSYPKKSEIAELISSNVQVEELYSEQCIDAISKGLEGLEWSSDSHGLYVDNELIATNDQINEIEQQCLRDCNSWKKFKTMLADEIGSLV